MYTEMLSTVKNYGQDEAITEAWDAAHKFVRINKPQMIGPFSVTIIMHKVIDF